MPAGRPVTVTRSESLSCYDARLFYQSRQHSMISPWSTAVPAVRESPSADVGAISTVGFLSAVVYRSFASSQSTLKSEGSIRLVALSRVVASSLVEPLPTQMTPHQLL